MMIQTLFIYSDKIEYGVDGNGRNMVYSSRVAVKSKHHKVNVYVMFLCPRNTLSRVVAASACPEKNLSKIKLWGIHITLLRLALYIFHGT